MYVGCVVYILIFDTLHIFDYAILCISMDTLRITEYVSRIWYAYHVHTHVFNTRTHISPNTHTHIVPHTLIVGEPATQFWPFGTIRGYKGLLIFSDSYTYLVLETA